MLHCEEYKTLISALLDEEITEAERGDLMNHLGQCANCAAYLQDQIAMGEALRGLTAEAPAGFAESVMDRVRRTAQEPKKEERKALTFPQLRRWAGLAACCAVVALGAFALGGLPRTMNDAANCAAAPESFDNGAAYQTYTDGFAAGADTAAPEYGVNNAARAEIPESKLTDDIVIEEALDCKAVLTGEYAALLSATGKTAQQWVEETLGEEWVVGASYSLTAEQFGELQELLQEKGESFTVLTATEESDIYVLLAE